jgi:hypothetical protein
MKTKRDIFGAHYQRYQKAGKKDKGKILAELAGTTGLNRGKAFSSQGTNASAHALLSCSLPRTLW